MLKWKQQKPAGNLSDAALIRAPQGKEKDMTITYAMTASLLFIGLTLMLFDVSHKLKKSEHRTISLILIGTSMFYVAMDCLWIIVYTGEDFRRGAFIVFNFLFYLVYITLPYIWFLFSRHFSGGHLKGRKWDYIFAAPWLFNMSLVLLTMAGTGLLWRIGGSEDRYTRGPLFGIFSNLNLVYYFIPVISILYLLLSGSHSASGENKADRRTLLTTLGFSLIPALGVFIYTYWISVDAIYPFQPCCFFIGVMFAYILLLSQVYKRAEEDNLRLAEEARAAGRIADLMGSVGALLTNMPAMTFSKDVSTGRYLACNQFFAEYAHKASPEDVVGLTDHDIFDPVTADHFVEDDRKATAMAEPYVFFEDVPDAKGFMRNLQTTKLTFKDGTGRLCLLGMCVDVTEMTRIKEAEAEGRIRQQELEEKLILQEEKLALQEQVLAQEQSSKELNSMITAMASDYRSVYHVDIDADDAVCYRADPEDPDQIGEGVHFAFHEAFTRYGQKYVDEEFREGFLHFIDPDNIREVLATENIMAYRYLAHRKGRDYYEMLRMAGVRHPGDRDDHQVHAVGLGFTVIDKEMREQMSRNHELAEALSAAENANRAKTAFLSNMSHEIRTPMNAIIGLNNIAMNEPDVSDRVKEHLEKIGSSARHLLGIINDILDMSRIESGRMVVKSEEFSFAKALDQVNTIIGGQCRDKGLTYNCTVRGHVGDYYIGDDMKLRQVMINILGNAVKFTPEGGSVDFIVETAARFNGKSTLCFTIRDTGIGMSKEYLPRLFDPFSQEDSSTTSRFGSTGLGMPITKSIVELMNGHIDVESEKGKGTTFTVTVTLVDSDRRITEDTDSASGDGMPHPHEMCVLVIDDDPVACEHARIILGQVGISCEKALSGLDGIEMVKVRHTRREPYNLILVDWKMPDLDGIETTRQIRAAVGDETPVIILTSFSWEDIEDEARLAGVDTFVSKPLFAGNVLDEFREAFKKKNARLVRETADLKGRRVLLAEDVPVNAEIMTMVLSMREMDVDLAENGQIAVDKFSEHEPGYYAAILMDMRMPVMDGLTAARTIRSLEDRPDAKTIPIIALTANAFDEDVQRSMQAGLNAHLSKPVEPEALFQTLEGLVK